MKKNDEKINKLREVLLKKKADLKEVDGRYKTNMTIVRDGKKVSLLTKDKDELINSLTSFLIFKNSRKEALVLLGLPNEDDVIIDGYLFSDWFYDIKLRMAKVDYATKKSELERLEEKLERLESEDSKTGRALDDIGALLNN